ncbi:mannose-6-phosphate isomerase, class I [Agromyces sp. Marseille-P2726]|uniref:mannose-6-phosphate isomerase, class I n=1 Tax=Agromyces sp. Marseille-P2726 TaxID=2709132 RepID=UPI0015704888|nr:mannose-6-phosphate isomerase, class I [Agromyces sp. Marseille-P2726]
MHKLAGVPREYDWGSTTHIQDVLGVPADGRPLAEFWFGAHPTGPSPLLPAGDDAATLEELIAADPVGALGERVTREFDQRLPFLMKFLAPGQAVSLQVHPSPENAVAGFNREEAAGIPIDAFHRSFKDTNHKPEMVFAITDFEGLVGFRPLEEIVALLGRYDHPILQWCHRELAAEPTPAGLRECLRALVELGTSDVEAIVDEARTSAAEGRSGAAAHATVVELAATYPGDAGAVASLMLNRIAFAAGECVFVSSGTPHAYLRGLAVEIMANSDNVFRAGLTSKYVDVEGLLDNVAFSVVPVDLLEGEETAAGVRVLRPDAREFQLTSVTIEGAERVEVSGSGPRIAVCVEGRVQVRAAGGDEAVELELAPGEAVFAGDTDGDLRMLGTGDVVMASVPMARRH